jgi:teichuronic acid biosynthesis glycosyltransferase TuaC
MRIFMIRVLMCGPDATSGGVATHNKCLTEQLKKLGVVVISHSFSGSSFNKMYQRTFGLLFKSVNKQHEYDIIHVQCSAGIGSFPAAITGAFISILLRKRFIFTYHNSKIKRNILFKFCLKNADRLILVSQFQKDLIKQEYPEYLFKALCIPNGFNNRYFFSQNQKDCKERIKLPKDTKVVLTVGNLYEIKGHRYFIDAIGKITSTKKDIIGVIVGSGPLERKLRDQIHRLGLEKYILMIRETLHQDISLWMNASDIFIFPSLSESFGIVQIEALACGKPIVATRNGGSEGIIISDQYGFLVEPQNSNDLAEKIFLALDMEWDREAILAYADRFTWDKIAKETMRVYKQISRIQHDR